MCRPSFWSIGKGILGSILYNFFFLATCDEGGWAVFLSRGNQQLMRGMRIFMPLWRSGSVMQKLEERCFLGGLARDIFGGIF